jgi:hypothetical protein
MMPNPQNAKDQQQPITKAPDLAPGAYPQADGTVLLIAPDIQLMGDLMQNGKNVMTSTRFWKPKQARIVGALVVVDEFNCAVPLNYVHVIRWAPPAPAATETPPAS